MSQGHPSGWVSTVTKLSCLGLCLSVHLCISSSDADCLFASPATLSSVAVPKNHATTAASSWVPYQCSPIDIYVSLCLKPKMLTQPTLSIHSMSQSDRQTVSCSTRELIVVIKIGVKNLCSAEPEYQGSGNIRQVVATERLAPSGFIVTPAF